MARANICYYLNPRLQLTKEILQTPLIRQIFNAFREEKIVNLRNKTCFNGKSLINKFLMSTTIRSTQT